MHFGRSMTAISPSIQAIADPLGAITGAEHLRLMDGNLAIAPANTEEVAAVLRYANQNALTIVPWGGGTKQKWGHAVRPTLLLETRRLNALQEHTWQDMTCVVEAGCTWSSMQSALARQAQFAALDPLWPGYATVGGITATNDSGTLRLRYGGLRDIVIGMTIVLADGTIARSGGKVVKNVAGYDLHKLMIGAFGTLGVITAVNFRLHALPRHHQSFTVPAPSAVRLGELLLKLLDSHYSTQSIQLRATPHEFALDIRLSALPEVLSAQATSLLSLAHSCELTLQPSPADTWDARQRCFGQTDSISVKATMLPSHIAHFSEIAQAMGGSSVTQATGIMIANFPAAAGSEITKLRRELETAGGSLIILDQPGPKILDPWGSLPDAFPLMGEMKHRFDPNRILNPCRFLGGI